MPHIPVLLHEVLEGLKIQPDDVVLDGTINGGGHSIEILSLLGKKGALIGMDRDEEALARAKTVLKDSPARVILINDNFQNLDRALADNGFEYADKILFDLGLSSDQLEHSGRGFSFQKDEPLLMTFMANPGIGDLTAQQVVNEWEEESIASILHGFGEEKFAKRIAANIVHRRKENPITTSRELAEIVRRNVPRWYAHKKTHPATKTFQAIRMAVNSELRSIEEGLARGVQCLRSGGVMAVITFHSIEDRTVKNFFKQQAERGACVIITKKPIAPRREEIQSNKRSRSAKLRILKKL